MKLIKMIFTKVQSITFVAKQITTHIMAFRMIKYNLILFTALLIAGGCASHSVQQTEKPEILVTILPEKSFIEKIAGSDFNISVLVPPGANPATYSLSPSQMIGISRASAWFRMGYVGFELTSAEKIREVNRKMKVVDLSSGLDLISGNAEKNQALRAGVNSHTWLSPRRVKIMALQIKNELISLNPGKEKNYTEGYLKFLEEINSTDSTINRILKNDRGKKFITIHPSLCYFAKDYGLSELTMEEGGKEPTPAHLAFLTETAKKEGIKAVFIQSDYDQEVARTFADEIHGQIIRIWPLNPDWSNNLISIAGILRKN